jgi:hypothetical protein
MIGIFRNFKINTFGSPSSSKLNFTSTLSKEIAHHPFFFSKILLIHPFLSVAATSSET